MRDDEDRADRGHDEGDAAAEAFEAVRGEVALLRRAVERLAAERAEVPEPPDYSETLGELQRGVNTAAENIARIGLTLMLLAVTMVFSVALHWLTGIPLPALVLAFAPGGLAEMSLVALALGLLALRLAQHPGIVFGVLKEALLGNPVVRQLGIARQRQVLFNDLLGRAANLALGPRGVENAVDHVPKRALAVRLVTRTGFG